MGKIGNLGSMITFEVSSDKVLTFDGMQQTAGGRWAQHNIIGGKPVSEFLGADLRQITLPIFLTAAHSVNPRRIIERLESAAESGQPFTFVLGGKRVGKNEWVVSSVGETWGEILDGGKLLSAHLDLTLSEYV